MNKNLVVTIIGVLVPVAMVFVFGYWAWVSYVGLFIRAGDTFFVSSLEHFNLMVVAIFLCGFFVGMSCAIVPIVRSTRNEAKKKQEREQLKEEFRKELEMEKEKRTTD